MHFRFLTGRIRPGIALLTGVLVLFTILLPIAGSEEYSLPDIGDPSGNILTPAAEKRLGKAFMRSIRRTMPVVTDPLMQSYMQSLGNRLTSQSDDAGQPFSFFLIDSPTINAFAGPGGHIGIYTGLMLITESESELASVMAHEIAHVTQKHLARTFDAANQMTIPAAAMILAAIVLGAATDNSDLGLAASAGIQAGMLQHQINFTRSNEKEADRVGMQILSDAEFDPRAMPSFFSRMGKANRLYDTGQLPEFLRTHPVTTNRVADSRGRAENYPYRQYADSLEYHLLRTTLREKQFTDPGEAVTFFRKSLADGRFRNEQAQRYGYVRALTRSGDLVNAKKELQQILRNDPQQIPYLVVKSELQRKEKKPELSLKTLRDALKVHPGNLALSLYYAEALLHLGQPAKAQQLLEEQVRRHPDDTQLYRLLAQAAGDAGRPNEGHQYLAEYYYLSGELEPAAQQLEIALKKREITYYRSARMSARLKEIKQEIADLKRQKEVK
jgi:predicted Zn-dependent protease